MKKNNTNSRKRNHQSTELSKLLEYTKNITLDDNEFNRLFNEQENILCDIKSILTNGTVKCENNIKHKLLSKKYINNYNDFKQNYYTDKTPQLTNNAILEGAMIIRKNKKTTKNMPHKKVLILKKT